MDDVKADTNQTQQTYSKEIITTDDPNGSPKRCKFQQNYELAFARNQHILCHQVGV